MLVQTFLGRLVIVGRHQQTGIRAGLHAATGQIDGFRRRIGTSTRDHRNPPPHQFDKTAQQLAVLLLIQGSGLTRGAHRNDCIAALGNMELDQRFQTVFIDSTALTHGGDQRNHTTVKHEILRGDESQCAWYFSASGLTSCR